MFLYEFAYSFDLNNISNNVFFFHSNNAEIIGKINNFSLDNINNNLKDNNFIYLN